MFSALLLESPGVLHLEYLRARARSKAEHEQTEEKSTRILQHQELQAHPSGLTVTDINFRTKTITVGPEIYV